MADAASPRFDIPHSSAFDISLNVGCMLNISNANSREIPKFMVGPPGIGENYNSGIVLCYIPGYRVFLYKVGIAIGRAFVYMQAPLGPKKINSCLLSPHTSARVQ